jgi:dipeptidyl aminopeptidase/acylaminoacyl peptidase
MKALREAILLILPIGVGLAVAGCSGDSSEDASEGRVIAGISPAIPVEDFFRSPARIDYKLSPDGRRYAYVGRWRDVDNIFVQEIGETEALRLTSATERDINRFTWGNDNCILYLQDDAGDENYRLYRVTVPGGDERCLTDFPKVRTQLIDLLVNRPNEVIITVNLRDPELLDPWLLDIVTGELTMLAENPGDVQRWQADNAGVIRLAFADNIRYRPDADSAFREVLTIDGDDTFSPRFFTPDNRTVYAYSSIGRDRIAIVEFDLAGGREIRVLFEDSLFDAFGDDERDRFEYSSKREKLLYALYSAERRKYHFFDEGIKELFGRLVDRIGDYEVNLVSANSDFTTVIVEASSDRQPGVYYLYDVQNDKLRLLGESAPWLNEDHLATMDSISFKARDGLTIHGYLTLPQGRRARMLPLVVNPHAGPQWRNTWGWDAKAQFLASRGYAVLHVNFRGSLGYGKAFMRAGFRQWGLKIQDDISDGVNWLVEQGVADPERIAIFGWSFGGYATLAGLTFTPDLYSCGVNLWGISNYFTLYESFPAYWKPFLTQINERWGDVVADSLQMFATSPVFHVDRIRAPLFIAQGANDSRVRRSQSEQLVTALRKHGKEFEYMLIEGEGHAFSNERKTIDLMSRIDAFLSKHMGPASAEAGGAIE